MPYLLDTLPGADEVESLRRENSLRHLLRKVPLSLLRSVLGQHIHWCLAVKPTNTASDNSHDASVLPSATSEASTGLQWERVATPVTREELSRRQQVVEAACNGEPHLCERVMASNAWRDVTPDVSKLVS